MGGARKLERKGGGREEQDRRKEDEEIDEGRMKGGRGRTKVGSEQSDPMSVGESKRWSKAGYRGAPKTASG